MGNKEDWEELEKWQREHNEELKIKYGANLDKPEFKKVRKNSMAVSKFMDKLVWSICYIIIAILILTIFMSFIIAFISWSKLI